jgi:hypothetical protein
MAVKLGGVYGALAYYHRNPEEVASGWGAPRTHRNGVNDNRIDLLLSEGPDIPLLRSQMRKSRSLRVHTCQKIVTNTLYHLLLPSEFRAKNDSTKNKS